MGHEDTFMTMTSCLSPFNFKNRYMNKIVLSLLSLFLLIGVSFAVQEVGVMDLSFCNGANRYNVTLDEQSTTHEICMSIMNK